MKIGYWIVTIIFCLMMIASAFYEFFAFEEFTTTLSRLGYPSHLAYLLPATKILGVAAILGNFSRTLKEWAYAGFFFDFVLAILAHYISGVPSPFGAAFALAMLLVTYYFDRKVHPRGSVE